MAAGPLTGIKVLDFTQVVAGPVASMLLAELGAEVIKVEYPGIGDITRSAGFSKGEMNSSVLNCNRGKRSIQIDLNFNIKYYALVLSIIIILNLNVIFPEPT